MSRLKFQAASFRKTEDTSHKAKGARRLRAVSQGVRALAGGRAMKNVECRRGNVVGCGLRPVALSSWLGGERRASKVVI